MVHNSIAFRYSDCQKKYEEIFNNESLKAKCFDEIASLFFDRNFGSSSKAEIDLLMFHLLMERLIKQNQKDGVIDYRKCSDYSLSRILGISESKIRNLKIKKNLAYPEEYNWIDSFASIVSNSKLTRTHNNKVLITIPDPNVMIEVRNFLEENGDIVEKHLNSKILEMDMEYLFLFAIKFEEEHIADEKLIKRLKSEYTNFIAGDLLSDLRETSESVNKLCSLFSAGNKLAAFIKHKMM